MDEVQLPKLIITVYACNRRFLKRDVTYVVIIVYAQFTHSDDSSILCYLKTFAPLRGALDSWTVSGATTTDDFGQTYQYDVCRFAGAPFDLLVGLNIDRSQGEKAMQYMLMCCINEAQWGKLQDSQRDRIMDEYMKLIEELKKSGRLLAGGKLDWSASAVTVREKDGKPVITDGPFAETREQLGGYHLIECKDREEAVSIAWRIPTLPVGGTIEVRPLVFME